jgi:hexosaminidase
MAVVRYCTAFSIVFLALTSVALCADLPALVPAPEHIARKACTGGGFPLDRPLRFARDVDPGGFEILSERWRALGIPLPVRALRPDVVTTRSPAAGQPAWSVRGYSLEVGSRTIGIRGQTDEAAFDALATLAQLPMRRGSRWRLPCASIADRPALRWRIVSDDISRGPFPTMRYFKERIRTLAGLKINGWSPYMEQVFRDPLHPYVAFPAALSAGGLHALARYAERFHVALVPQQQTFAHMHEALKYERLAGLAELPHGYLMAESDPATYAYLEPLVRAELRAVGRVPFFHIGADEPIDLGRGRTPRTARVFAAHVARLGALVAAAGARPLIWDDAVQQDPAILGLIPKRTVIVSFHYGAEPSFAKYIATVAGAGFDQLISPGANNWNEIYADLDTAYANAAQFIADGKAAHVLGMFETVWHDDGESLYEATWAPVAFAAASAWQFRPVDRATWNATFARAFFGSDDARFGRDLDALGAIRTALRTKPQSDPPNYLFWSDPFDTRIRSRMDAVDLRGIRLRAEDVITHLTTAQPLLHQNAARVMRLAALRYDVLGRRFQIGSEARAYYDDARAHVAAHDDALVYRGLNVAKYLCWELRDEMTALEPEYARAWRYESTPPGLARVVVRYRLAAERAVIDADRLNAAAREDYLRGRTLPSFEHVLERSN